MSSDQAIVTVKDTSVPEKRKTKKSKKDISKKKKKSKKTSPAGAGEIKESKSLVSTFIIKSNMTLLLLNRVFMHVNPYLHFLEHSSK